MRMNISDYTDSTENINVPTPEHVSFFMKHKVSSDYEHSHFSIEHHMPYIL